MRTRSFLFNEEDQDTCPLCHQAKETNTHVARCMHEAVKEHQEEATKLLQSELKKIGTHTTVANTMTAMLHNNNIYNYTHNSETDEDEETKEILARQKKIGWSNWEYRWRTLAWNKTHEHQRKKYKHSKYSGGKWAVWAQQAVWTYVKSFWINRNKLVHGKDDREQRQVRRLRVEAEVTKTYDEQPNVGQSAALQKPLHKILQRSTGVLKA